MRKLFKTSLRNFDKNEFVEKELCESTILYNIVTAPDFDIKDSSAHGGKISCILNLTKFHPIDADRNHGKHYTAAPSLEQDVPKPNQYEFVSRSN